VKMVIPAKETPPEFMTTQKLDLSSLSKS